MVGTTDPLELALASLRPAGVTTAYRVITFGDEYALLPHERVGLRSDLSKVLRASGAARRIARDLLRHHGLLDVTIPRSACGAPVWPSGIVGSLAHDETVAVAAIADTRYFLALGIDVEPPLELPSEMLDIVTTPTERNRWPKAILSSRVLFALKEAVYKALSPLDGVFLDFHDVEIDLTTKTASTSTGRKVDIAFKSYPKVLALAYARAT